jgi:hypothetical protein
VAIVSIDELRNPTTVRAAGPRKAFRDDLQGLSGSRNKDYIVARICFNTIFLDTIKTR